MINCIDTHAHLASSRFDSDREEIIAHAAAEGVTTIVSISCDREDSRRNLQFAESSSSIAPAVGIHPLYVHEEGRADWEADLRVLAAGTRVAALGEIGLDYFHSPPDALEEAEWKRLQRDFFEAQLQIATDLSLPVVVHQRDSAEDVAEVLAHFPSVEAVLHCFTGTRAEAERALEQGHHLSFTGILTFPSAEDVREVARWAPKDRIMVETDCPFLAPIPFRGKRCEPAHVVETCRKLAEIHDLELSEMASLTSSNARRFFRGLPSS